MNTNRKIALIAGVLFLTTTISGILSVLFTGPIPNGPSYLAHIIERDTQVKIGALFELLMAFSGVGISVSLFPILWKNNVGIALGAVVFRTFEAVIWIIDILGLLLLLSLSQEYVKNQPANALQFQPLSMMLLSLRYWADLIAYLAFIIGALMYYFLLFQSKSIPRWLSGWGLVGVPFWMSGALLTMFNVIDLYSTIQVLLFLPIAIQEVICGVWLIFKGFYPIADTYRLQ
jgi:hypothetical protein